MATISSFEDFEVWKNAQTLGLHIYALCSRNTKIANDFSFKDQLKRAALSISSNIAEGYEYSNNNSFLWYLRIAKGSCGEVRNLLLFAVRLEYLTAEQAAPIIALSRQISFQVGSLIKYLRQTSQKNNR